LNEATSGNKKDKIEWTEDRILAFDRLKEEIKKEVSLSYPDYSDGSERLELFVDASKVGVGATLMQKQDGEYVVIGYGSMCFSRTQINYPTIHSSICTIWLQAKLGYKLHWMV